MRHSCRESGGASGPESRRTNEQMLMNRLFLCLLVASSFLCLGTSAQNTLYTRYIAAYKDLAVEQMKRHGVPASITLAQGLLESGAGKSRLAVQANNHFGIKCGSTWKGPYILATDDAPNERFRAYKSVRESYEDHSDFLRTGQRYAFLFDLKKTDYKGWAKGLKKAGYATNPRYADNLIAIIETYGLHRYDVGGKGESRRHRHRREKAEEQAAWETAGLTVRKCNDNYYVVARSGDTFASIARLMGVKEKRLREYNEVGADYALSEGDIVYFEKKKTKAARELKGTIHTVQPGESLYSISQRYGMRLKTLYKLNRLPADHVVSAGERLIIR